MSRRARRARGQLFVGYALVAIAALVVTLTADAVQDGVPLSTAWAILDVIAHATLALTAVAWLGPRWGWKPLAAAAAVAVLIDLDHAVVARSLDTAAMMDIGSRPPTHSLVAAVALGALSGLLLGGVLRTSREVLGYAVGLGLLIHIWGDAVAWPGVPLWWAFDPNPHVILPVWTLVLGTATLAAANALLSSFAWNTESDVFAEEIGGLPAKTEGVPTA